MQQTQRDMQVFRPALLPDNRRLVWYPLTICGVFATVGYFFDNPPLAIIPVLVIAVFPGIPITIHSLFFLSVKITLYEDRLIVVDWAGDPFISYPRRQEIALPRVAYVYHLQKEAEAHQAETVPMAPFSKTNIKTENYRDANANPRRAGAVARTNNGLVLSDKDGEDKIYIMHFHDLSQKDWQQLARQVQKRNKDISFLMTDREKKGLLG